MPKAAIDIGSNSILLTVLGDDDSVLTDEVRIVGLGKGLGDSGMFLPDRMKAAEAVLEEYVQRAQEHGVSPYSIRAVATSAARRSMNARTWFSRIQRKHGLRVSIITGEEEARLTWLGALGGLNVANESCLVIDLGGGSTELVFGRNGEVTFRTSMEVGSVRLTEKFLLEERHQPEELARLKNHLKTELKVLELDSTPTHVVGVAGTVTTLCATHAGLAQYEPEVVHGRPLTRDHLTDFEQQLLGTTQSERRAMIPLAPERADYLLAGVAILDQVLRTARCNQLITSNGGIRYGVLQ